MNCAFALSSLPTMALYQSDPILDPRWVHFLDRHPKASVFHTPEWLECLVKTYGYRPVILTSSPPGEPLTNGIVCCEVESWLTGRRLVSLPFSDHCEPLVEGAQDFPFLLSELKKRQPGRWKYVEIRPRSEWTCDPESPGGFSVEDSYFLHTLDLKPGLTELFRSFHPDSVRRKIRRAEREGLTYEAGRSEALLDKFYHLLLLTRRRHHLPPQPLIWFRNLISCLREKVEIRVASRNDQPVASILTLRYKGTMVYKYGCSDVRFHNWGGMALLFWRAIQDAKAAGLWEFDFGRSDLDQTGLITFKNHWGTTMSELVYMRYPQRKHHFAEAIHKKVLTNQVLERLPNGILVLAGKLLYKHIA